MIIDNSITSLRSIKRFESLEEDFRKVHGDKFDYSKVVYFKTNIKVEIICPEHGSFFQTPANHLKFGCDKCAREESGQNRSLSEEDFYLRIKEVHGTKYNYSETIYKGLTNYIKVICPKHGLWETSVLSHLQCGCPKCGDNNARKLKTKKSKNKFIKDAPNIHDNFYSYNMKTFEDMKTKMEIICPKHGSFWQSPSSHLQGHGCTLCHHENVSEYMSSNTEEFIQKVEKVHNNFYDYSLVKYERCHLKVKIICPHHGVFEQSPDGHIQGQGCPKCANERCTTPHVIRYKDTPTLFYSFKYKGVYKIGVTTKTFRQRYYSEIEDINDVSEVVIVPFNTYPEAFELEQNLIERYRDFRYYGKPIFKGTGITEIFIEDIYSKYLESIEGDIQ